MSLFPGMAELHVYCAVDNNFIVQSYGNGVNMKLVNAL